MEELFFVAVRFIRERVTNFSTRAKFHGCYSSVSGSVSKRGSACNNGAHDILTHKSLLVMAAGIRATKQELHH